MPAWPAPVLSSAGTSTAGRPTSPISALASRASIARASIALLLVSAWGLGLPFIAAQGSDETGYLAHEQSWFLPEVPSAPLDLALDDVGGIFVADAGDNAVLAFDAAGALRGRWTLTPDEEFYVPATLAFDRSERQLHILWHRYVERAGETEPEFVGVYLDTRRYDGGMTRPLRSVNLEGKPQDMAMGLDGKLYVSAAGQMHAIVAQSGWVGGGFELGDTSGAGGQIAVVDATTLAVIRASESRVDLLTPEGIPVGNAMLGADTPLSVAGDLNGTLHVLVRTDDPDDPSGPIVRSFDAGGKPLGSFGLGQLGAPTIAEGDWPWSIAAGPDGFGLSAGNQRFHTLWYDSAGQARVRLTGGLVRSSHAPQLILPQSRPAMAMNSVGDADLLVYDGREDRLVRFDEDGRVRFAGGVPPRTLDIATAPDGTVYASTREGELHRLEGDEAADATWTKDCDCSLGGRIAVSPGAVYITRPRSQSVGTFDPDEGLSLRAYRYPQAIGLWPSDVAVAPDGTLFTADLINAQVQGWKRAEAPDAVWQAGLLAGPRRIAAGMNNGEMVVAALMADGYAEIHETRHGRLRARWQPRLSDGSSFDMSDIAVGPEGRVYIADARAHAVHVFSPGFNIPPTEPAEPTASPTPSELSCRISGDKFGEKGPVVQGHTTGMTLTLSADCPNSSRVLGADILLVIDRSGSMRGEKLEAARGAARDFAELLDVRYHRIGLVSFSGEASVDVPLGDDVGAIVEGLSGLSPMGETNMAAGLRAAATQLGVTGRAEALPVIVLLTDGQFSTADDPRTVAAEARNAGAQIYTIGLGGDVEEAVLIDIAGERGRYFPAPSPAELYPIYTRILREVLTSLAGNLVIDDRIDASLRYVEGSARPSALNTGDRLRWARSLLPASGITMSYAITATLPGCHPSSLYAVADYTDADGERRRFDFPVPTVCVITPTPTPTATHTPSPTHTPEPRPIYLPILNGCRPATNPVDVVLLLDTSSSMAGEKLEQAKSAATTFVELLDRERDQAAIIGFNTRPVLAAGLTSDPGALRAAIAGLQSSPGTYIDRALEAAVLELLGPRRKPGNQGVIVLLSDGAHNGSERDLLRAAQSARSLGAIVYAIGLGADVNLAQLEQIAGPERTFFAADGEALREVYRRIAVAIPCR